MSSDLDRVAEIRRRLEAATPGPWERIGCAIEPVVGGAEVVSCGVDCMSYCYGGTGRGVESESDADLIAAAPADLAWACDTIQNLIEYGERQESVKTQYSVRIAELEAKLEAEKREHDHHTSLLGHMTEMYKKAGQELRQREKIIQAVRDLYERRLIATVGYCTESEELFLSDLRDALDGS